MGTLGEYTNCVVGLPNDTASERAAQVRASAADAGDIAASSRKNIINVLWECTQAFLAVSLVSACIFCAIQDGTVPETLRNATFVVIGFYFGRTNHTRPVPRRSDDD